MELSHYNQVNWVDGMKINKSHFIAMEDGFINSVNKAISCGINDYNYGLLPPYQGRAFNIRLTVDHQQRLNIKILNCKAVTTGGFLIDIQEGNLMINDFSISIPEFSTQQESNKEAVFYLLLSANPFVRVPVGEADPEEEPPRYPYTIPEIKADLIPEEQMGKTLPGSHCICIGKMKLAEGQPEIDNSYIPACTSVQGHPALKELHNRYNQYLGQLELDVLKISKRIKEKEQDYSLAKVVALLSEHLLAFLSSNILPIRWMTANQMPLVMFTQMASCARVIKNTIDANTGETKVELLNYLTEWCQLNQGDFEKVLLDAINFSYDHLKIKDTANVINQFVELTGSLFSKLSTLEYIGKKKETGIFVKEEKGKSSFLAD